MPFTTRCFDASILTRLAVVASTSITACEPARRAPEASFVAVTADSTHWVRSQGRAGEFRIRRSAMLLGQVDGRLVELFVHDDDQSFFDALVVGQRVYRRDLISGDSIALWSDSVTVAISAAYGRAHPRERRLLPDEETAEEPAIQATIDTELLGVDGPLLSYELHRDVEVIGDSARDEHLTTRGVLDIRTGRRVTLHDLTSEAEAERVLAAARRALVAAQDSIRGARDERAQLARTMIPGFRFDAMSFVITREGGALAVAFLVPGRGPLAGGYALPLPPIVISAPPWWAALAATRPVPAGGGELIWPDSSYDVVSQRTGDDGTELLLRQRGSDWNVARTGGEVESVHRLSTAADGIATERALDRAFDEMQFLEGQTGVAAFRARPARPPLRAAGGHIGRHPSSKWTTRHRGNPKRSSPI